MKFVVFTSFLGLDTLKYYSDAHSIPIQHLDLLDDEISAKGELRLIYDRNVKLFFDSDESQMAQTVMQTMISDQSFRRIEIPPLMIPQKELIPVLDNRGNPIIKHGVVVMKEIITKFPHFTNDRHIFALDSRMIRNK